ncbi:tetratricopeptide repeat protein [Myroides marinus]|uniref:tetratricopeptide repeat protein n=1 Tax=Myroides marinus TaxID=703342 RepID=UPI002578E119|nr:tetratricopeptide repeat protein [Myroides marinus]MDM1346033.1 tetratricopeptide repeat protein [Myroides marinus]MDM1353287.1 tetratricopeptide repeat protein [Myroides marinus]
MNRIKKRISNLSILLAFSLASSFSYAQTKSVEQDKGDYVTLANKEFNNGKWETGKSILDKGIVENPNDSDLHMLLGKYYHHLKQYDKARYELNKAIEITPENIDAKHILVNVETETKRYSSAICYVNEILEVSPYLKSLWKKKIHLYELQGNQVEADRLRKRLFQIYPNDQELKKDYTYSIEVEASKNRISGDIDKAISLNKELVKNSPDNLEYHLVLINDFIKGGDTTNALMYTERALAVFPHNSTLLNKKIGILADQKNYDVLLSFLQQNKLSKQYDYYALEAARHAKLNDPFELYSKVLNTNSRNEEAFNYVYNQLVGQQQYEEALHQLTKFKKASGASKALTLKELQLYSRMGNKAKEASLIKELYRNYPTDVEVQDAYYRIALEEAKSYMQEEQYELAIEKWNSVLNSGKQDTRMLAYMGLYNSYLAKGDYGSALHILNQYELQSSENKHLGFKKADIYFKLHNYNSALSAYEEELISLNQEQRTFYLKGYEELCTAVVKEHNENFLYNESLYYIKRWLAHDPTNRTALVYGVNLSHQLKREEELDRYLQKGVTAYPEDVFFQVKLAEYQGKSVTDFAPVYAVILNQVIQQPYHEMALATYEEIGEKYVKQLIKEGQIDEAMNIVEEALIYVPDSKELKYTKGLVLEKQKKYAEAQYYQSFYAPSPLEVEEHKKHLQFLGYKSLQNEVGIEYLRSRFDDESGKKHSIASAHYTRHTLNNSYTIGANYTGRDAGRGIQGHIDWSRTWTDKWSTNVNVALADAYFPKFAINGSVFREVNFLGGVELELGAGYRKFQEDKESTSSDSNMFNVVFGATKQTDQYSLNVKLNNFFNDGEWMYNLGVNARYFLSSPKHFIAAMAGVGSSPEVELIDYQLYDTFDVFNTNVGAGYGTILFKNVTASVMGTWYNYKANDLKYKNFYNLYFSINVVF